MKTPPNRVAVVALVLLVLACIGVWWWTRADGVGQDPNGTGAASADGREPKIGALDPQAVTPIARAKPGATSKAVEQCGKEIMGAIRERTRQLAVRDDAPSQLAFGLMAQFATEEDQMKVAIADPGKWMKQQRQVTQRALGRARELAPAHADAAWLAAQHCFDGEECRGVQQALLDSEPDNMAAWLAAMSWARARSDDVSLGQAFVRAAKATHYDTHRGATFQAVTEAYAGLSTPPVCREPSVQAAMRKEMPGMRNFDAMAFVEMSALAGESAQAVHAGALGTMCSADQGAPMSPTRRRDCISIYTAMAGGGTLAEESLATSNLVRLTRDSAEGEAWRERYRNQQWLWSQVGDRAIWAELQVEDYVFGEAEALQQVLRADGRWPAPAGWLPQDERARSLILTGRPPESRR